MNRATISALLMGVLMGLAFDHAAHAGSIGTLPPTPPEPLEHSEPLDAFGYAMAVGDFNGDGFYDLAASAPGESFGSASWTGVVLVFEGTGDGGYDAWRSITRSDAGFAKESWDYFGYALAAGDYDGDGYDDLAIGAPGADGALGTWAGQVHIVWGSHVGLSAVDTVAQSDAGELPTGNDAFGFALATGDFNGDGTADLAIGAIRTMHGDGVEAGEVFIMTGSAEGLQAWSSVHQETPQTTGIPGDTLSGSPLGTHEPLDWFGLSLAVGDLDQDGRDDLVVGAPGDKEGGPDAGAVYLFLATDEGMGGWLRLDQTDLDANEVGDLFGWTVAVGNFKTKNYYANEIIVGAPSEDLEAANKSDAGWIYSFELSARRYVPLYGLGQTGIGADNASDDRFGSTMLAHRYDDRDYLLVAAPGDGRGGKSNVGEVLVFAASPSGPVAGAYPNNPDAGWFYGRRTDQHLGRALAVDPSANRPLISGDEADGRGVINDYVHGPSVIAGIFQETTVYSGK